jgi:ankyrin repeat protein
MKQRRIITLTITLLIALALPILWIIPAFLREKPNRDLIFAIKINDADKVRVALDKGADPNTLTDNFPPPRGMNAQSQQFLFHLLHPHFKSPYCPVLKIAAYLGNYEAVEQLLSHGAEINDRDDQGDTALVAACDSGSTRVVKLLLDHHADTDIQSHFKALTIAEYRLEISQQKSLPPSIAAHTANPTEYIKIIALLKESGSQE